MRRAAIALLAAAMLTLSGCTLSIYNSYRDIESLEVVQALGLDSAENGGVLLSVATGSDASGKEPVRLKQEAESIDGAMRGLEELAGRGTLFFSGTQAIVLGKEAANEAARWLDAVARSKELRLDTELFVLKNGEASELLTGENAPDDVSASLNALADRVRSDGPSPVPTCADISRSLIESGAALAMAIDTAEDTEGKAVPISDGFAILTPDGLAGWLEGDEALGAGLFLGELGISIVELSSGITAELAGADVSINPVWGNNGEITGIDVAVEARGSIIEAPPGSDLGNAGSWDGLEAELADLVCGWAEAALNRSVGLNADFLGFGRHIESTQPVKFENMPVSWQETFPDLEVSISGSARILNIREYSDSPYAGVNQ